MSEMVVKFLEVMGKFLGHKAVVVLVCLLVGGGTVFHVSQAFISRSAWAQEKQIMQNEIVRGDLYNQRAYLQLQIQILTQTLMNIEDNLDNSTETNRDKWQRRYDRYSVELSNLQESLSAVEVEIRKMPMR